MNRSVLKLSLRNVKTNSRLSEETICFSADLYLDDRKVAQVANRGHGGPDEVYWIDREAGAKIEAHFASLPDLHCEKLNIDYRPSLEEWCCDAVAKDSQLKRIKRKMSKVTLGIKGKDIYTYGISPANLEAKKFDGETGRAALEKKFGCKILNGLADGPLWDLIEGAN